ncbi:hypothetical protein [Prescottella sp. R16]|uniref:hypothetical protein n=1 Tax=Prescottella sp. R16 TaxID=3064529 RepID=UPI00272DC846|nr:hypothetical protein [Prescottella sp. R16]
MTEPITSESGNESQITVCRIGSSAPDCGSYGAGHHVHWIQARKAFESETEIEVTAVVDSDGLIRATVGDEVTWFRNHDPDGVAATLLGADSRVVLRGFNVLQIHTPAGRALYSIEESDQWQPCRPRL